MGKRDRSAADAERRLADDVRRTAGYMDAVVTRARALDVAVPEAIAVCVDTWRGWFRGMDPRAGEGS
jgi:hypothetical protein